MEVSEIPGILITLLKFMKYNKISEFHVSGLSSAG
jgi:hypothetical protein